jgi:high frequency lysogenization protein
MNTSNQTHRILALAGLIQAAKLVKQISTVGRCDESALETCVHSIFTLDAPTVEAIYGGTQNLTIGLQELIKLFTHNKEPKDSDIARYLLSLIHLERKLSKKPAMLQSIKTGIERAHTQAQYFSTLHDNVLANLAGVYTDTLSTFSFRIHVTGLPLYLNQNHHLNKVRTLLLAGIRSAVLWHQLGGRRWQLLIMRSSILQTAHGLLKQNELTPA